MALPYYDEGFVAATSDMGPDSCPYDEGTGPANEWHQGYLDGSKPGGAFAEGVDAYGRGLSRKDGPFEKDSDEEAEWQDGWDEAKSLDKDEAVKDNL